MSRHALHVRRNPVLRRELLERWRGNRAMIVVTGYIALLALFTILLAWIGLSLIDQQFRFEGGTTGSGPLLGRFLVENLLAVTLGLALLLAPAYAATQISGERERKTLALLRITLVRPGQIVVGKLGASVAWLLLLVLAAVPLMAIGFFLGGITLPQLLRGLFTLVALTIAIASIGIGISSMTKRSTPALIITILTVGALTVGSLFLGLVESVARDFQFSGGRPLSTLVNPYVALADAVDADRGAFFFGSRLDSVLTGFASLLPDEEQQNFGFDRGVPMPFPGEAMMEEAFVDNGFGGGVFIDGPQIIDMQGSGSTGRPYWLLISGFYLAIGALFLAIAARRVAKVDIE